MNNFDYYNRNLYDVTGSHLTETLIELAEDERWENKDTYYFYNFSPIQIPDQSPDPENACFKLIAQPTHNQPGSGRIYFHGEDPSWKELEEFVQDSKFREIWKNYNSEELKGKDFIDPNNQACVLLSYEIARRVKVDPELYPVTREQTIEAIDKVMSTTGGEYPNMVDLLIQMFCDGNIDDHYKGRLEAYNQIMGIENTSVDSLGQKLTQTSLV